MHASRLLSCAARVLTLAIVVGGSDALAAQQTTTPADSGRVTPANLRGTGPNGATLRCRDGSYPAPMAPDSACEGKGGVLLRFRLRGTPPPLPARAVPVAPAPAQVSAPPDVRPPSRASVFVPPPPAPAGATLMCKDGTYIVADTSSVRCASNGGVKLRFRSRR
jgi:hypothetical protein